MSDVNNRTHAQLDLKYAAFVFKGKELQMAVREVCGVGIGVADFTSCGELFMFADEEGPFNAKDLIACIKDCKANLRDLQDYEEFVHLGSTIELNDGPGFVSDIKSILNAVGITSAEDAQDVFNTLADTAEFFELGVMEM